MISEYISIFGYGIQSPNFYHRLKFICMFDIWNSCILITIGNFGSCKRMLMVANSGVKYVHAGRIADSNTAVVLKLLRSKCWHIIFYICIEREKEVTFRMYTRCYHICIYKQNGGGVYITTVGPRLNRKVCQNMHYKLTGPIIPNIHQASL